MKPENTTDLIGFCDHVLMELRAEAESNLSPLTIDELTTRLNKNNTAVIDEDKIRFAIEFLKDGEMIREHVRREPPAYSITFKGFQTSFWGGIKGKEGIQWAKNALYGVSLIAVTVAGIYYVIEIYKFFRGL